MNPRITHLKIKIHTLADEARHIRREERKTLKKARRALRTPTPNNRDPKPHYEAYESLHGHRTGIVREAARSCHLAYGYLRGTPYKAMESSPRSKPDWREVKNLIARFGGGLGDFDAWRKGVDLAGVSNAA